MIKTFTSEFENTAKEQKKEVVLFGLSSEVPSENTLKNILNYSRNLEVKQSKILPYFEFLKS